MRFLPLSLLLPGLALHLCSVSCKSRNEATPDAGEADATASTSIVSAEAGGDGTNPEARGPHLPRHRAELTLLPTRGNAASCSLWITEDRYAQFSYPRGEGLKVTAEFLGRQADADRWKLKISPEKMPEETKEVEYAGKPLIVWSNAGRHIVITRDSAEIFEMSKTGVLGEERQKYTR